MDKPTVILIADSTDKEFGDMTGFATVAEAQAFADTLGGNTNFEIFTLYTRGTRPTTIAWELLTDNATNLRENTKAKAAKKKTRGGNPWTQIELDALIDARRRKVPLKRIAENLGRTYASIYTKSQALKKKGKL